jgi:glycosyltransferase involved in cell wall biosynthesis
MRAVVITPTIGTKFLQQAIDSVHKQTIPTEHWIIVDGKLDHPFDMYPNGRHIVWPENVGHSGWNGHRYYAAAPLLTDADYVLFLDEDNWFEPNHVEDMINFIKEHDLQWCYSLRNIVDQDGKFIAPDDCESLGRWPSVFAQQHSFVDTNCFCFKTKYLALVAYEFFGSSFYQDRLFYTEMIKKLPYFECTGEHTVNYRVRKELYDAYAKGNKALNTHFKGKLPWHKYRKTK